MDNLRDFRNSRVSYYEVIKFGEEDKIRSWDKKKYEDTQERVIIEDIYIYKLELS